MDKKKSSPLEYAEEVASGQIGACKWVRLACERHFNDLDNSIEMGIYFDDTAGMHAINFIERLKHYKGKWAGRYFKLEPWQKFIVWQLFGWKRSDGTRRYRYAYIEVARKNGKTALSAAIGLYMLVADGEAASEIYSAATIREQAGYCFNDAKKMVQNSQLNSVLQVWSNSITFEQRGGSFKALSSDRGYHDGMNPSCAIVDEFHAHKDSGMFDVLKSAMGARSQPLTFIITTAGFNKQGVCFSYRDNVMKVLQGVNVDDSLFGIIFTLDDADHWDDPDYWSYANPNLGVSVYPDYLEQEVLDAKNRPEAVRNVKTKHFNLWVDAERTWILDERWMECGGEIRNLERCEAYGGLDLANVSDITAYVLIFNEDEKFQLLPFFWIPEETMIDRIRNQNINYDHWVESGLVRVTPGNVTDYDYVMADILEINQKYSVKSIAYDRWNSSQLIINLTNEGLNLSPMGQGYASLSAPTKQFEALVLNKKMEHFSNPVLRWMLNSAAISSDPAGNVKIDKQKSSQKIDGIAASIMALGSGWTAQADKESSPYAKRGLREL